jgi:ankyrin repeat protein
MVQRLLAAGALPFSPGGSALMVAVENARVDAAAALLAAGHDRGKGEAGSGAWHSSSEKGDGTRKQGEVVGVEGALAEPDLSVSTAPPPMPPSARSPPRFVVDLDSRDAQGWTAVAVAAGAGHTRLLSMLLEAGASADARTAHTGRTPLMAAAQGGHAAAAEVLIRHARAYPAPLEGGGGGGVGGGAGGGGVRGGDDVGTGDGAGGSGAGGSGGVGTAGGDMADGGVAGVGSSVASISHVPGGVRCLVDATDAQGVTALMLASKNGHAAATAVLLAAGADPTATDMAGLGALELCAKKGAVEVARLLLGSAAAGRHARAPAGIAGTGLATSRGAGTGDAAVKGVGSGGGIAGGTQGAALGGFSGGMLGHAARALPIAARGGFVDLVRELSRFGAPTQPHLMRAAATGATEVSGPHRSYLGVGVVSAQVVWGADATASDESSRNRSYRGEWGA